MELDDSVMLEMKKVKNNVEAQEVNIIHASVYNSHSTTDHAPNRMITLRQRHQ